MRDIPAILKAVTLSSLVSISIILFVIDRHFTWPILPIDWGVGLMSVGCVRLALRVLHEGLVQSRETYGTRALIVGAGDGGELLMAA